MKKNAFTLIELLAIIVILAIIAVITVPIILNIIDDSKRGAAQDSAYGYKDAVGKFYLTKLSTDSNYIIPDDIYGTSQLKSMGVIVSGQEPGDVSWVDIKNNRVVGGCLQFDEYKVDINNDGALSAVKGECGDLYSRRIVYTDLTGEKYFNSEWIGLHPVFYDPISGNCDIETYNSNSNKLNNFGCMKWYVYSENSDGTLNLLLDHNTSVSIPWTLEIDEYSNPSIYYTNANGPREAYYQLYQDTKDWSSVELLSSTFNYSASWSVSLNGNRSYLIDYSKHFDRSGDSDPYSYSFVSGATRARFINSEEIAYLSGKNNWSISDGNYYFDGTYDKQENLGKSNSKYSWLFDNLGDCESFGCNIQDSNSSNKGYWTSGAEGDIGAWEVWHEGGLISNNVSYRETGIRPVIVVAKTIINFN